MRTTKGAAGWTPTVIRQPNGHETTYFKCPNCPLVMVVPVDHECYEPNKATVVVGSDPYRELCPACQVGSLRPSGTADWQNRYVCDHCGKAASR